MQTFKEIIKTHNLELNKTQLQTVENHLKTLPINMIKPAATQFANTLTSAFVYFGNADFVDFIVNNWIKNLSELVKSPENGDDYSWTTRLF